LKIPPTLISVARKINESAESSDSAKEVSGRPSGARLLIAAPHYRVLPVQWLVATRGPLPRFGLTQEGGPPAQLQSQRYPGPTEQQHAAEHSHQDGTDGKHADRQRQTNQGRQQQPDAPQQARTLFGRWQGLHGDAPAGIRIDSITVFP